MKTPSPGMMAAGLIGLTGIILVSIGAPSSTSGAVLTKKVVAMLMGWVRPAAKLCIFSAL